MRIGINRVIYFDDINNENSSNEYIDLISNAMNHLPNEVIIHRLTGDGAKKILIAPLWTANKKKVMNALKKRLESR